jgi:ribosomal protein L16/L10AE
MMQPKKVKYRKIMKGRVRGAENRGVELAFGDYGLKSIETCRIDSRVPGQALHQEAGRDSNGQGQGRA